MVFLEKFSGLTDGRTTEKGDPFCSEIRLGCERPKRGSKALFDGSA